MLTKQGGWRGINATTNNNNRLFQCWSLFDHKNMVLRLLQMKIASMMSPVFLNLVCSTCLWTVWVRSNVGNPGKSQIFWQAMPNKVSSLGGANARVRMSKIWRQWKILCSYRASSEEVDVDEIHVIQCSLKDSLLQRSGQIHGPLEYSVQSWHVHLVEKSEQDWPREKIEDKLHLLKYLESTNL